MANAFREDENDDDNIKEYQINEILPNWMDKFPWALVATVVQRSEVKTSAKNQKQYAEYLLQDSTGKIKAMAFQEGPRYHQVLKVGGTYRIINAKPIPWTSYGTFVHKAQLTLPPPDDIISLVGSGSLPKKVKTEGNTNEDEKTPSTSKGFNSKQPISDGNLTTLFVLEVKQDRWGFPICPTDSECKQKLRKTEDNKWICDECQATTSHYKWQLSLECIRCYFNIQYNVVCNRKIAEEFLANDATTIGRLVQQQNKAELENIANRSKNKLIKVTFIPQTSDDETRAIPPRIQKIRPCTIQDANTFILWLLNPEDFKY